MPEIGYQYQRIKDIDEKTWQAIIAKMKEVFSYFGYDRERPWLPRNASRFESISFTRVLSSEDRPKDVPEKYVGVEAGWLSVSLDYPDESSAIPDSIEIRPHPAWEGYFQCDRTTAAMEKLEEEGVLKDAFKIVYKCLPEVTEFRTEAEKEKNQDLALALFVNKKIAPGLF